jgi:hypothetical protein
MKTCNQKSRLKRDGPLFLFSGPAKVACDEKKIIAVVAPRRRETSYTTHPLSGRANLPVCPNKKTPLSANVAIKKFPWAKSLSRNPTGTRRPSFLSVAIHRRFKKPVRFQVI